MRDEFVRDFWREFGEEYEGDVLKLGECAIFFLLRLLVYICESRLRLNTRLR
jgi:hypothetical protein